MGPSGVLGIWGEWLFIFRELGSTGSYFRDLGSKLIFWGSREPCKKVKTNLAFISFDFFKIFGLWGEASRPPFENLNLFTVVLTC